MITVGIDPANRSCGLAIVRSGGDIHFDTFDLYDRVWMDWLHGHLISDKHLVRWVSEVPQNGTHKSREGVVRALGAVWGVLKYISPSVAPPKLGENMFYPRTWRKRIFGHSEDRDVDYKQLALDTVTHSYDVRGKFDHNAAEALLLTEMLDTDAGM